jgi:formylglycine-generating enzyme
MRSLWHTSENRFPLGTTNSKRRMLASAALGAFGLLVPVLSASCGQAAPNHQQCSSVVVMTAASAPAPACSCAQAEAEPTAASSATAATPTADKPVPCAEGVAFVEGDYCPLVEQRCLEHAKNKAMEEMEAVCVKFEKPSTCLSSSRVHMRYCMDKYEYPNKPGEMPRVLVTWEDAAKLCKQEGKRLCSESEFNFACEGEEMLPYSYGYERDANKCNVDKPYKEPGDFAARNWSDCERDKTCKEAFDKLDQRGAIGERAECVSPFGVYDLNGNVNELVMLRYKEPPHRAALKGGWWGPVRGRCRPIVSHHDEKYLGYEVGFRCCSKPTDEEAKASKKGKRERTAHR